MNETYMTAGIAAVGMFASWAVWVTVMVFELRTKILLMRQEIHVLKGVKDLLESIRDSMRRMK